MCIGIYSKKSIVINDFLGFIASFQFSYQIGDVGYSHYDNSSNH